MVRNAYLMSCINPFLPLRSMLDTEAQVGVTRKWKWLWCDSGVTRSCRGACRCDTVTYLERLSGRLKSFSHFMEATIQALGGLIVNALPTLVLVILLHFYLKQMFFKPLDQVLKARYDATQGAMKLAQEAVAKADKKTAEFEEALRQARAEIYREQEQARLAWRDQQASELRQVREEAKARLRQAKEEIASAAAVERGNLAAQTEALALQIFRRITQGRAA